MIMGRNFISENFFYTTSKSPGGPWSYPPGTMQGTAITYDFEIAVGPDGSHYMVTDVWTNKYTSDTVPQWDLWVHRLAPNLTSALGNDSSVLFRTGESLWKDQG